MQEGKRCVSMGLGRGWPDQEVGWSMGRGWRGVGMVGGKRWESWVAG